MLKELGNKLIEKNLSICSSESLTGGLFGSTLVEVSGISKVYKGSVVAYQDEVGVKKTTEDKTASFYASLKKAHDAANKSRLWADVEVFTFEGDVYKSALLPANIERLKKQLEAVSPYVDEILIFEYQGMFNKPGTIAFCGHPDSIQYYKDYKKLLDEISSND